MKKEIDISGKKFNRLTAIKSLNKASYKQNKTSKSYWLFKCDCGNEKIIRKDDVVSGIVKSCGCLQKEMASKSAKIKSKKHGDSNNRLYRIYHAILNRCYYKKDINYQNYGNRGICVCDEWNNRNGYKKFKDWAIKNGYNDNLTIDRIDVNGDYCPENCRWATHKQQGRNTRTNHYIVWNNEKHCISEWAEILGINPRTLQSRISRGWDLKNIFTKPIRKTC